MDEAKTLSAENQTISRKDFDDFIFWSKSKLSEEQKILFYQSANSFWLNPIKKEIMAVTFKRKDQFWNFTEDMSLITSYQIYLRKWAETWLLNWWKVEETYFENWKLKWAKITIYRKDFQFPFEWEVLYSEIAKKDFKWEYSWQWKDWSGMPIFMCKKVAIWQWFRLAFPEQLWNMPYLSEELDKLNKEEDIKPQEPMVEKSIKLTTKSKVESTKPVEPITPKPPDFQDIKPVEPIKLTPKPVEPKVEPTNPELKIIQLKNPILVEPVKSAIDWITDEMTKSSDLLKWFINTYKTTEEKQSVWVELKIILCEVQWLPVWSLDNIDKIQLYKMISYETIEKSIDLYKERLNKKSDILEEALEDVLSKQIN